VLKALQESQQAVVGRYQPVRVLLEAALASAFSFVAMLAWRYIGGFD
jgi:hypothetical protein